MCESLMPACLDDIGSTDYEAVGIEIVGVHLKILKYCIECFPERCSDQGPIGR